MAELVDALVSNTSGSNAVGVQFPLRVQTFLCGKVFVFLKEQSGLKMYYRSFNIQILHPKWPEFPSGPSIILNPAFSYNLIARLSSGSDSR
jgi:hypothetical protein